MFKAKKITLLIGGSIAAYKAAYLTRELVKRGCLVRVAMSKSAQEFVTPLTFQTLSNNPVRTNFFDPNQEGKIDHIELATNADLILVVPATADIIAKAALGLADDLVQAVILAASAPILFAPAMNVQMWENPATMHNVKLLRERGHRFVEPGMGSLACGFEGVGRLAETAEILDAIENIFVPQDLTGSHVIVTAGATREWCDPIRFVSNRSSGRMGYALAKRARMHGANVSLISGPSHLDVPFGVALHRVSTAEEMRRVVFDLAFRRSDSSAIGTQFVFMVAAVCDHRPADVSPTKLKHDKSSSFIINMVPNPDILNELGGRREEIETRSGAALKLIGFTAETGDEEDLLHYACEKLDRKNADLMVGNFVEDAFEKETNRVWLLARAGHQEEIATADKDFIAEKIINAAMRL